jgi:hypothetical protein
VEVVGYGKDASDRRPASTMALRDSRKTANVTVLELGLESIRRIDAISTNNQLLTKQDSRASEPYFS